MRLRPPGSTLFPYTTLFRSDVRDDDARLRAMLNRVQDEQESREGFDRLRKEYPLRRECNLLRVVTAASEPQLARRLDRKSTRLNSSHVRISYAVFCLKKKKK